MNQKILRHKTKKTLQYHQTLNSSSTNWVTNSLNKNLSLVFHRRYYVSHLSEESRKTQDLWLLQKCLCIATCYSILSKAFDCCRSACASLLVIAFYHYPQETMNSCPSGVLSLRPTSPQIKLFIYICTRANDIASSKNKREIYIYMNRSETKLYPY